MQMSQPTQMASDHDIMITHTCTHKHTRKETGRGTQCDVFLSNGRRQHVSRITDTGERTLEMDWEFEQQNFYLSEAMITNAPLNRQVYSTNTHMSMHARKGEK